MLPLANHSGEAEMARTPLAQRVEDAFAEVAAGRTTRRELVKRTAAAGVALAGASTIGRFARVAYGAAPPVRIAIVGAGLAGLTCGYRLKQAGLSADIYEASDHVGGRCQSDTKTFAPLVAEHGGELIDQGHTQIRQLAQELGLKLVNLLQAQPNGTEDFFYVDGHDYPYSQLLVDLNGIYQQMHKDVSAASYPTLWNSYTQRGWELDHMSIIQWLDATVPKGGSKSDLGRVLDIAYNIEYGAECSEQSSLNLLYLLGYRGQGQFRVFGASNEKYHVIGGNQQIADRLGGALTGQISLGLELTAIKRNPSGSFSLTLRNGSATLTPDAYDHVVLALPFSLLRSVNYSKAGFEPLKVTAIKELPMGTNSKLHVEFKDRFWYDAGNNGNTYADTGYQNTWEVSRAQNTTKRGLLVDYTGGKIGASFGSGTPQSRAQQFMSQLQPLFDPYDITVADHWTNQATIDFWTAYPWTKGSYSYWKVGQYTKFSGMEKERQGNCHFCGEHTSQDFQGYLNGAVETGERVVDEILGDLK
jgi:monoamine oxidase